MVSQVWITVILRGERVSGGQSWSRRGWDIIGAFGESYGNLSNFNLLVYSPKVVRIGFTHLELSFSIRISPRSVLVHWREIQMITQLYIDKRRGESKQQPEPNSKYFSVKKLKAFSFRLLLDFSCVVKCFVQSLFFTFNLSFSLHWTYRTTYWPPPQQCRARHKTIYTKNRWKYRLADTINLPIIC